MVVNVCALYVHVDVCALYVRVDAELVGIRANVCICDVLSSL